MKINQPLQHTVIEVEYFGNVLQIPASHEWLAMDRNGKVFAYMSDPVYDDEMGTWDYGLGCTFIGSAELPLTVDAANTLHKIVRSEVK